MDDTRLEHLRDDAEEYARTQLGGRPKAVEAKPAGDGRSVAVLINDEGYRYVVAYDEANRLVTDAGLPEDFGWAS